MAQKPSFYPTGGLFHIKSPTTLYVCIGILMIVYDVLNTLQAKVFVLSTKNGKFSFFRDFTDTGLDT